MSISKKYNKLNKILDETFHARGVCAFMIYAELDTPERITNLALKNRIRTQTCYNVLHKIEQRGNYHITWGVADDGYSDTVRISRRIDCFTLL